MTSTFSSVSWILAPLVLAVNTTAFASTASVRIPADDTTLNLSDYNYAREPILLTSTWPDTKPANAILMMFDLSALPSGAVVQDATLHLTLVESDASVDQTYTVTAHKVLRPKPVIARATGRTADGVTEWTASNCCPNGLPLAQADISPAYDMQTIDKSVGEKAWRLTTMVQEWMIDPSSNFGLVLNPDIAMPQGRYRAFASMEHPTAGFQPFLEIVFSAPDVQPPAIVITAPEAGTTVSTAVTITAAAADNLGVGAIQLQLDGVPLSPEYDGTLVSHAWDTTSVSDGTHKLTAVARDWAGNTATSAPVSVSVSNGIIHLFPQDTFLNLDLINYSAQPTLNTYTWPDYKIANAIIMKFDLTPIPAGASVQSAKLHMALVESDAAADSYYTVTAHKLLGRNPVISKATGYTADGLLPWTPNLCCYNAVPLAQADISPAYDTQAIDKTAGMKMWTLTSMVQEWLRMPATNFGVLLNSDKSKPRDRYRSFGSMEHADAALRPFLSISYLNGGASDETPPSVSIAAPADGARVSGPIDIVAEATDNVGVTAVRFELNGASLAADDTSEPYKISWNTTETTNGPHTLRATARDAAGNSASGSVTVTVENDRTPPTVSVTAPTGGEVSGTIDVSGEATDNVSVVGLQFKLDGAALGATDSTAPYSVSWNTATAPNGSHTLTAVARDAAGNQTTSPSVTVTVANVVSATAPEAICPGGNSPDPNVVWCDNFQAGDYLSRWSIGSSEDTWPRADFVKCAAFGFNDGCAAWTNNLVFDNYWGYFGYDASDYFPAQSEFYIRFYQYISNPYTWGSLEDKSVLLHDAARTIDMYISSSRTGIGESCDGTSGALGKPAFINYQDRDWPELGGRCTKVNRFQNQGNDITLQPGKWYLFETYIKLNTAGSNNGIVKLWIDDATASVATQTLRLAYTDMRFLQSADFGKKLSELRLTVYNQRCDGAGCPTQRNQFHKWDNIVISQAPIGPMRGGSPS